MTLIDDMEATNDVALAVTSSLEQLLGEDVILAVGVAQRIAPNQRSPSRRRDACGVAARQRRYRRRDRVDRGRIARDDTRGPRQRRAAHVERHPGARSRRDRDERPRRRRGTPRPRDRSRDRITDRRRRRLHRLPVARERRARRVLGRSSSSPPPRPRRSRCTSSSRSTTVRRASPGAVRSRSSKTSRWASPPSSAAAG